MQRVKFVVCLSLVCVDIRMVQLVKSLRFNISTLNINEGTWIENTIHCFMAFP